MKKEYKVIDGISFDTKTPDVVCSILALHNKLHYNGEAETRLRLWYGDTQTGQAWPEEFETMGYIGRSCGRVKIPLMIKNSRSAGGGGILDHCVVAISAAQGGKFLYKHPSFSPGKWEVNGTKVLHDGKDYAYCKTVPQAQRLADFMCGKRNSK